MTPARDAFDAILHPRTVAVVGATESPGYGSRLMLNLTRPGSPVRVLPINPGRERVYGIACLPSLDDMLAAVDCAVIVVPAPAVAATIASAAAKGIPSAIVISAGFAESGSAGLAQEELQDAAAGITRLCGPNCLGVANVASGLWASANILAPIDERTRAGTIAIVSQSGATAFGPLLWASRRYGAGLRYVVSSGNEVDLTTADFIEYAAADRDVTAIACVIEGVRDPARFRAALAVAQAADKPVVILKVGRTSVGARAATTHTAAIAGTGAAWEALLRHHGVARASNWDELILMADTLGRMRRTTGGGVGIISHSGGVGATLGDACAERSLFVPDLTTEATDVLATILGGRGAARNPADITFHIERPSLTEILELMAREPDVATVAVATAGSTDLADRIGLFAESVPKPVIVCWTGGEPSDDPGPDRLRLAGVPVTYQPDQCAGAIAAAHAWATARARTERLIPDIVASRDPRAWEAFRDAARTIGMPLLPDHVGLTLARAAGIAVAPTTSAVHPDDASERRRRDSIEFPVVIKLNAAGLAHRHRVGAMRLGIRDDKTLHDAARELWKLGPADEPRSLTIQSMVEDGHEILLGFLDDASAGPMLVVGRGGVRVERAETPIFVPLPLASDEPDRLADAVLDGLGASNASASRSALSDTIAAFAGWVHELRGTIHSAELNPVIVGPSGAIAVDCLIVPKAH
ncbi:MAG: hypothetical protein EPO26_03335 [Chloroflexota bacterium]|nr:MAG: hypothetical protein EPO26_03335 [Chloroflexota bacterium]